MLKKTALSLIFSVMAAMAFAQSDCLLVVVHNLRSTSGVVRYALYNENNTFASYTDVLREGVAEVKSGTVRILICDLPDTDYGICLLHDENNDGDMNFNALGIPKEGFGFSNDAKVHLSPPKFNACRFIKKGETAIRVKMRYML
ncbi:MAG TPA: DUF2141 domain-containing protein [Bacteroidales bacterium]|nr:DUF2141 domain-containing protein [Bacteroidales bacterium]